MNYRDYIEFGVLKVNTAIQKPVNLIAASTTLTAAAHAGATNVLSIATGCTLTLPAATGSGNVYEILVGITVSSNTYVIKVANGTDEFGGSLVCCDTDTTDAVTIWPAIAADGYDTITMDGSTKGGLIGNSFTITDVAAGSFACNGFIASNGTVATPFSAGVS